MAHTAFININSSLDASPFPSVDQSITWYFSISSGPPDACWMHTFQFSKQFMPPPPLIYWCVLKSGYFPDIGLWVYFIELSTGGNEYIKNTDKWDISVDSGKTKQIGSSSSQESFSGNDGRQIRLFKEELGLRPNGCGRSAWRGPRKAECGSLSILTEHASPGPGSPSNRKEKSHMVKLLIEV